MGCSEDRAEGPRTERASHPRRSWARLVAVCCGMRHTVAETEICAFGVTFSPFTELTQRGENVAVTATRSAWFSSNFRDGSS